MSQRKRTIGKLRVLLHQHLSTLGSEQIEVFALGAVMGEEAALTAVNQARDNKRESKQQRLKDKKESFKERMGRRREGRTRTRRASEKREAREAIVSSPTYAVSCLLMQLYP